MPSIRLYKRSAAVKFGDASLVPLDSSDLAYSIKNLDDDGYRIRFRFFRTNRGEADKGWVELFNLPEATRIIIVNDFEIMTRLRRGIQTNAVAFSNDTLRAKALQKTAESYGVTVYAGYDKQPEVIFRGDMLRVQNKRVGNDTITRIELGDTLLALRDGYINQSFGSGTFLADFLGAAVAASGLEFDEASKVLVSAVALNAVVTVTSEGIYAVGRPADTIDEVADLFGLQWWVKEGKIFFVANGATTQDFTIILQEGATLLDHTSPEGYEDISGLTLMSGKIHPGRGLILLQENGLPLEARGYRTNAVDYVGDTHGREWNVRFEAAKATNAIVAPSVSFDDAPLPGL